MKILLVFFAPLVFFAYLINMYLLADQNGYDVVKVIGQVEIRSYKKMIYASYTPNDEEDKESSFRLIANYIFGGNANDEQIAMTSPVVIKPYNNYEMAFIMPNNHTINSLPEPSNDKINLYEVPSSIKAAITYSGYTDSTKETKMKMLLIKELTKYNIDFDNDFEVFVYDAPYKFINRRNEIVVSVNMKSENNLKSERNEIIYLGGGCFWCTEAIFENVIGVESVVSGYAGGIIKNPTYKEVASGKTNHAEVCKIEYNLNDISLENILKIFFSAHDPTTINSQGNDYGKQYRSIILFPDSSQKGLIEQVINNMNNSIFNGNIVTQTEYIEDFYIAEKFHQDYYEKNKSTRYCRIIISPKIEKFKKELDEFYK
jgi:methionine-S-sulfoxide reductase